MDRIDWTTAFIHFDIHWPRCFGNAIMAPYFHAFRASLHFLGRLTLIDTISSKGDRVVGLATFLKKIQKRFFLEHTSPVPIDAAKTPFRTRSVVEGFWSLSWWRTFRQCAASVKMGSKRSLDPLSSVQCRVQLFPGPKPQSGAPYVPPPRRWIIPPTQSLRAEDPLRLAACRRC